MPSSFSFALKVCSNNAKAWSYRPFSITEDVSQTVLFADCGGMKGSLLFSFQELLKMESRLVIESLLAKETRQVANRIERGRMVRSENSPFPKRVASYRPSFTNIHDLLFNVSRVSRWKNTLSCTQRLIKEFTRILILSFMHADGADIVYCTKHRNMLSA